MGLFGFLNKEKFKNNEDLAEELFAEISLVIGGENKRSRQVEDIMKKCETRQDVLNKIIDLVGEPSTPRGRYLLANAYAWSKVELRKQSIKYIELYLNNPLYEEAYKGHHHSSGDKDFSVDEEKNIHISHMYSYLGKAYEGEYEFDKALECYKKEQELAPYWAHPYCHICSILIKQNNLDEAMAMYLSAKKSPYYKIIEYKDMFGEVHKDDTFVSVIDSQIIDLQKKMDKGYVYKPRKKKENM